LWHKDGTVNTVKKSTAKIAPSLSLDFEWVVVPSWDEVRGSGIVDDGYLHGMLPNMNPRENTRIEVVRKFQVLCSWSNTHISSDWARLPYAVRPWKEYSDVQRKEAAIFNHLTF
jgi:hypothetical protein